MIDVKDDVLPTDAIYADRNGQACTLLVSNLPGGEGGGGAFTDLTDAPATITADAVLVGNSAGTALEQVSWFHKYPGTDNRSWVHKAANEDGGDFTVLSDAGHSLVQLYADDGSAHLDVQNTSTDEGALRIEAYAGVVTLQVTGLLGMSGCDVVASDAAARLTVNAVEYSIAKAIKVKIGADTYFWPLFGPVAP
jgi:hypothetical protein